jgi:hypothetical protein
MGNVCLSEDRPIGNEVNYFNNKQNLTFKSTMTMEILDIVDEVQKALTHIKFFIPQSTQEPIHESFRFKYTEQLLHIRAQIIQRMRSHTDKYDGSCAYNERIGHLNYDGHYASLQKNPQDGNAHMLDYEVHMVGLIKINRK